MIEAEECAEFGATISAAGWSADRQVETSAAIAAWSDRGYVVSEAAVGFVANFDGTRFEYSRNFPQGSLQMDSCVLDAVEATGAIFESVVRSYEIRVSEKLCPIGLAASRHLILLMGSSGRIYGGYDSYLGLYGENGYEALCRIFNRKKGIRIP